MNTDASTRALAHRASHRRGRGFTLVEMIATISILGALSAAASGIILSAWNLHTAAVTRINTANILSGAMERITGELRNIEILAASSPATPSISAMTATSITFTVNGSSRVISLSGTDLRLSGAAASNAVLASNISAFTIQGYDKSNVAVSATPSAAVIATIRRIQITITGTSGTVTETIRTKVFIRSMASGSGAV
ncbi:MAG: prepilin-type N-terminal cleavage/methylation domain-containing protein [Planctomycetota bacterium]|nr:prepilin-type N-terminal cleavage/methylation domain-containing protein [Planctomycetota bacterium]